MGELLPLFVIPTSGVISVITEIYSDVNRCGMSSGEGHHIMQYHYILIFRTPNYIWLYFNKSTSRQYEHVLLANPIGNLWQEALSL